MIGEGKKYFLTFIFMTDKNTAHSPKIPEGLNRCRKCGYLNGKYKDDKFGMVSVSCACNPNICRRCNTPVHKFRIGSNYYDEQAGHFWHIPMHMAWAHKCPDGTPGQLENSFLIDPRTGEDLLKEANSNELPEDVSIDYLKRVLGVPDGYIEKLVRPPLPPPPTSTYN
jgi:hypothetical protein